MNTGVLSRGKIGALGTLLVSRNNDFRPKRYVFSAGSAGKSLTMVHKKGFA
jgi:hypothetical protein